MGVGVDAAADAVVFMYLAVGSSFEVPPPGVCGGRGQFSFFFSFYFISVTVLFLLGIVELCCPAPRFLT